MSEHETELLDTIRKIHDLLELMAEDKIAQRDAKQRDELRRIVGSSKPKQAAVLLMNGSKTQKEIHALTNVNQGHLSTMLGQLKEAKLLVGETKLPRLLISIPSTFFEKNAETN